MVRMTLASKKIALISDNQTDHHVWTQAFENHPDRLTLDCFETAPDYLDDYKCVIDVSDAPVRVGSVMDDVEAVMLRMDKDAVACYKNYTLTWADRALSVDGKMIELTDREREIIYLFIKSGDAGCMRDTLLDQVWGYRTDLETHTLETHIYRLRQKVENDPTSPKRLITIDGGYALV